MTSTQTRAPKTQATVTPFHRDPLAIASAILFLVAALRFFNYCEDDVFIPMRYALNFWRGHGLVMNPGERVDGCTSALQLWLTMGLLRVMSPDQALFALKVLGMALGIAVMARTRTLARLLLPSQSKLWRAAPLLLVIQPSFTLSMINGLETSLATFFLVSGLVQLTTDAKDATQSRETRTTHAHAAIWFAMAALTRPELSLTFPLILVAKALRDRRLDWRSMAIYLTPLIALCVFRYEYYGDWLPNTYYAKHLSIRWGYELGIQYIQNYGFVGSPPLWMTLAGIGAWRLLSTMRSKATPSLIALGIHILFLLRSGGDWMIDGRFCMVVSPIIAVVLMSALLSMTDLYSFLSERFSRSLALSIPIVVVGIFSVTALIDAGRTVQGLFAIRSLRGLNYVVKPHRPFERWMGSMRDGRLVMADWVRHHARPGQTVLVGEVGVVPIANMDIDFIDVCGLTDSTIARMSGYPRGRGGVGGGKMWMHPDGALPRYVRRRRPEWVALLWSPDKNHMAGSRDSNDLYVPVEVFPINLDGYTQYIATWRRRDVPPGR